jgi:hypothetical protein
MRNRWPALVAGVLILAWVGCKGLTRPAWLHPGTATEQQTRAQKYDPYPENDLGPPVVGGRPMEYRSPPPEVQRVHPSDFRNRWPTNPNE